jgi:hypothetical protein
MPRKNTGADGAMVVCPRCHATFPLSEAMTHEIRDLLFAEEMEKVNQFLAREQQKLDADRERDRVAFAQERDQLDAHREALREEADKKAREEVAVKIRDLEATAEEDRRRTAEAHQRELEVRKTNRQLQQTIEDQGLAQERDRDQMAEQLRKEYEEANAAKLREKDERIERMTTQITELKRKADSGSRLNEGVPAQEVFAESLRALFPGDHIQVTRRGQAGADVFHTVYSPSGQRCGSLLYEAKRAATWGSDWMDKLRRDQAQAGADIAVIVSEVVPAGIRGCDQVDSLWVTDYVTAPAVAMALRSGFMKLAQYRTANALRQDSAGRVFDFIATGGFASRILELCRTFGRMQERQRKLKQGTIRNWAEQDKEQEWCLDQIAALVGDLVGLGAEVAPELRAELAMPGEDSPAALPSPEAHPAQLTKG